jgi:hypothetical protein
LIQPLKLLSARLGWLDGKMAMAAQRPPAAPLRVRLMMRRRRRRTKRLLYDDGHGKWKSPTVSPRVIYITRACVRVPAYFFLEIIPNSHIINHRPFPHFISVELLFPCSRVRKPCRVRVYYCGSVPFGSVRDSGSHRELFERNQ